jgi:uncharacterized membrane protein YccC
VAWLVGSAPAAGASEQVALQTPASAAASPGAEFPPRAMMQDFVKHHQAALDELEAALADLDRARSAGDQRDQRAQQEAGAKARAAVVRARDHLREGMRQMDRMHDRMMHEHQRMHDQRRGR